MLSLLSLIASVILAYLFLPTFNELVNKEFNVIDLLETPHLVFLGLIVLATGLISGSYRNVSITLRH